MKKVRYSKQFDILLARIGLAAFLNTGAQSRLKTADSAIFSRLSSNISNFETLISQNPRVQF